MAVARELAQIDLNLLYTFRSVVERGGVSAAAHALHRSQPAVSARLRQLEAHLGVALFERAGRGVALTAAGRAIADEVARICDSLQGVLDRLHAVHDEPSGNLRIGALPTVSAYVLAPVMAELALRYPEVTIELQPGLTADLLEPLKRGRLDMIASVGPPSRTAELDVVPLGQAVPMAVVPARSALARRARVSLAELKRRPIVGFGKIGDLFFDGVWAFFEEHDLLPQVRLVAPNIQTLQQLVLSGAGVAVLPGYTVKTPGLVTRPLEGLAVSHPTWLAVRRSSRGIPLVERFLEALEARAGRATHPRSR